MSSEKQWKSGFAEFNPTRDRFRTGVAGIDRTETEKEIAEGLAVFMQANEIGPGELMLTGRNELPGTIYVYVALYTAIRADKIRSSGFRFTLMASGE